MTLGLASRGYLCAGRGGGRKVVYGPGPKITSIEEQRPGIRASATEKKAPPTIVGAGVPGPKINQSTNPTPPPSAPAPVITGAGDVKPGGKGKTRGR